MLELVYDNQEKLTFASAGNLVNNEGFLHSNRCLDTFVLLIGKKGCLHITQNGEKYTLSPNGYLLLFPGMRHFGHQHSDELLSYYWCHFYMKPESYCIQPIQADAYENALGIDDGRSRLSEFGKCYQSERTQIQFRHLIDHSRQQPRIQSLLDFSISSLLLEIAHMQTLHQLQTKSGQKIGPGIAQILECVKKEYASDINVSKLAERFGYNPNYLSATFKKSMGISLLRHINQTRIDAAKNLLLNSSNSIKFIAAHVGFKDEKHFMKLFRTYENTTPTKYRNMYFHTHINRQ